METSPMTDTSTNPFSDSREFLQTLPGFLYFLKADGFNIGTDTFMDVHTLMLRLAESGNLPEDHMGLKTRIAPLVCRSPEEQRRFTVHFNQWAGLEMEARQVPRERIREALEPDRSLAELEIRSGKLGWLWVIPLVVTFTAAAMFLFGIISWKLVPGFMGIALLLAGGIREWGVRRLIDRHLVRKQAAGQGTMNTVFITPEHTEPLFRVNAVLGAARAMRRYERVPHDEIDVPATVDRTVSSGGWVIPVYGIRRVLPRYLVLVDRSAFNDHQAGWVDILLDALERKDLALDRYRFSGDPRACFSEPGDKGPFNLSDLAGSHPDHRLMIFSTGSGLVDPFTGKAASWTGRFGTWKFRALLVPATGGEGMEKHHPLAASGFVIVQGDEKGLAALVDLWESEEKNDRDRCTGSGRTTGPVSEDTSLAWMPPSDSMEVRSFLFRTRDFLGEPAWFWCCACAVFPEILWGLTWELGRSLKMEDGANLFTRDRFLRLISLPWFRKGYMPDWVRLEMIRHESFAGNRENQVRDVLERLLYGAEKTGELPIRYVLPEKNLRKKLFRRIKSLGKSGAFNLDPLDDRIFLDFMEHRLSVEVPMEKLDVFEGRSLDQGPGESKNEGNKKEPKRVPKLWSYPVTVSDVKVFISYAREDISFAKELFNDLKNTPGIAPWVDEKSLKGGYEWKIKIQEEMSKCRFCIVILSKQSVNKQGFFQTELKLAKKIHDKHPSTDRFLIPIRIEDCEIPPELNGIQFIDLFPDYEKGMKKLIASLADEKKTA